MLRGEPPIPREVRNDSDRNHSSKQQHVIAKNRLPGCPLETDTNILRETDHLSVMPITRREGFNRAHALCSDHPRQIQVQRLRCG
jgi:hypothetical protein